MSRDKNVSFAEEVVLDATLLQLQLRSGEWARVEEQLRLEAQLARDPDTGRLKPKKASEYTLRLIGEFLHMMRVEITRDTCGFSSLAVAEQCLRLIRSCAAYGMKIQTYICKDLNMLDDMLAIFTKYQHQCDITDEDILKKFDTCMIALTQTLGNLVVNNPFNQTIIWDKLGTNILSALLGQNEKIASCCAMIVYNILLGQPNVLPDDVLLLNSLAYMYTEGNSEFPHLIIEYLIGVENSYIEKLYNRLESDTRLLILNLAYNILSCVEMQDINVSVNFIKFISHEFKMKSDCILKTVDKYVNSIEPQEVVYLLDILATASSMDAYMECLQGDVSLFINCAFLLQSIHKLGKQEDNFFSSIHKLYNAVGKTVPKNSDTHILDHKSSNYDKIDPNETQVKKCDSTDMLQAETVSECTESESSEQYYECTDQLQYVDKIEQQIKNDILIPILQSSESKQKDIDLNISAILPDKNSTLQIYGQPPLDRKISDACRIDENLINVAFAKNIRPDFSQNISEQNINATSQSFSNEMSLSQKVDSLDDMEPPLITDSPEEIEQIEQKPNVLCTPKKVCIDVNMSRKDSLVMQPSINTNVVVNKSASRPTSRQQSVEPGIEASDVVIREIVAGMRSSEFSNIQTTSVQKNIELNTHQQSEQILPNIDQPQIKPAVEPLPPKKTQNISEFDLNEQLQKILGISDKSTRTETVDISKEVPNHSKAIESHPNLSQQTMQVTLPQQTVLQQPIVQNIPSQQLPMQSTSLQQPSVQATPPQQLSVQAIAPPQIPMQQSLPTQQSLQPMPLLSVQAIPPQPPIQATPPQQPIIQIPPSQQPPLQSLSQQLSVQVTPSQQSSLQTTPQISAQVTPSQQLSMQTSLQQQPLQTMSPQQISIQSTPQQPPIQTMPLQHPLPQTMTTQQPPIQTTPMQQSVTQATQSQQIHLQTIPLQQQPSIQSIPQQYVQPILSQQSFVPPIQTAVQQSPIQQNVDNTQKVRIQVKAPNVKIDSPENNQKTKLGNFEHSGPKRLAAIVESVEQHVAFGFKATLIRTLGNLCWKNQINKRQIRELEVIPVLLDCCNIDARNPLIMQWVILTVRNLCENCPENQAVISSLTLQEPVNNEVLEEMGLTLHTDAQNNKIKLVPLLKK